MINLIKKENLNLGILETDFDIFADIVNTFSGETLKKECLVDLDDYIIPDYFKNKMTIVIQTNNMLIGYATFEFKNINNVSQVIINDLYVLNEFLNKGMEVLLVEAILYVAGEVGSRNVIATINEHDDEKLTLYKSIGFYEVGINEDGSLLSISVLAAVSARRLNDKFRNIPSDYVDYKSLKLVKKITAGRDGNIYLTSDNRILKMFTSNSFTFIKDREETLKTLKKMDLPEVVKPKNLVYYDGIFVGYIMDYLPEGASLNSKLNDLSFEEKIDKIKEIEDVVRSLHKKNIYVCDLNLDNIFFDENGKITLIDCDSFVIKNNVINTLVANKYKDPKNKIVSERSDLYAFAVTALEILLNVRIPDDSSMSDIEKIYNKNKSRLPISFKNYYESMFKSSERYYLSDSYEKYLDSIYNVSDKVSEEKSGKISVIILSVILVIIAVAGYIVFKYKLR